MSRSTEDIVVRGPQAADVDDIVEVTPAAGQQVEARRWHDIAWVPTTKPNAKPVVPREVPEEAAPILYQGGKAVYAKTGQLYWMNGDRRCSLAYTNYLYNTDTELQREAKAFMFGNIPVFCTDDNEVQLAKNLFEKIDIVIPPQHAICFFSKEYGYIGSDVEDVIMIILTGDRLQIKKRYYTADQIFFENPVSVTEETYFSELSNFLTRGSRDVRADLAKAKTSLKDVLERKSEDVYLHISDLTPPPGKEQLHEFVLSRFSQEYEEDQLLLRERLEEMTKHELQLKAVKSQLPTGIKGKKIRSAYYHSPVLKEYLDELAFKRDGHNLRIVLRYSKNLVVEGIEYGRPHIEIVLTPNRGNGREGSLILLVTGASRDFNSFVHPHLQGRERWCLGTYIRPLQNAILGGNLPLVTTMVWRYLTEYNPGSPLVNLATCRGEMANATRREIIVRRK